MSEDELRRRRLLRRIGLSAGTVAIAGCPSNEGNGDRDRTEADGDGGTGTENDGTDTDGEGTEADESTQTERQDDVEEVTIKSEAGEVEGTLYGDGECGVVLTPQINQQRDSWSEQAERLAREYSVLAIDPVDDDRPTSVLAAIDHLQEARSASTVVPVGASVGGEASVVAAAGAGDVAAGVVGISASGGEDSVEELTGRSLFVVAEDDEDRFVETAHALHDAAPEPTELVTYSGGAHGQGLFETEHGDDLFERIEALVGDVCD